MLETVERRDPPEAELALSLPQKRELLVHAATRVAVERGVRAVEPDLVARTSGLSVAEFHRHFDSVDQCILAAFDDFFERMQEHIDDACDGTDDWPRQVKAAVLAGVEFAVELGAACRFFLADALRLGPAVVERQIVFLDDAALRLRDGRRHYPQAADLPETTERALIAGIFMLATSYLLDEQADRLVDVQVEAVEMLLVPYIGPEQARAVARGD